MTSAAVVGLALVAVLLVMGLVTRTAVRSLRRFVRALWPH